MGRWLLLLLLALPLSAQEEVEVWIEPTAPTDLTPITIFLNANCISVDDISRLGSVITVGARIGGICDPPNMPQSDPLPERTLPPGQYRIDVVSNSDPPVVVASKTFVVRKELVDPNIRFSMRPSVALSVGGVPLTIDPKEGVCSDQTCKILIDGTEVPKRLDDGKIVVNAPPHAPGLVDVTMVASDGVTMIGSAHLYYHAAGQEAPTWMFERVLFPILFNTPGAKGSLWRTETSISNPNRWWVDNANLVHPVECPTIPGIACGERLEPGAAIHFDGGAAPHGVALLVPRSEAPYLVFHSRVRDISADESNLGTEVPVVRERDMVRGVSATLLDVPFDPRYRVKLRAYMFDDDNETQHVRTTVRVDTHGSSISRAFTLDLRRSCQPAQCAYTPLYGELNIPSGTSGARANLYVRSQGLLTWAFASVTNNTTQQVTIVNADGAGGDPCRNCSER